jgi:hypothetical protein
MYIEIIIVGIIILFVFVYRNNTGNNSYKFIAKNVGSAYERFSPYSFRVVREKAKELGQEYTTRQYTIQIVLFGTVAAFVSYLYFYSILWSIIYAAAAIAFVPYLAYMRCKKAYSEFIFEQIQVYTTNTIMEFNTTQSFVKALEGVVESGVLEEPVLSDVKTMIALSYEKGDVTDSINYMNSKYPYYMVKNMHQLFLQVTKEGAKNTEETLDNMLNDIDLLVEGVYRDRSDRKQFHRQFLIFGVSLYSLIMLIQLILGVDSYIEMLDGIMMRILVHGVVIINSYFLLKGEKYYNENVGAE